MVFDRKKLNIAVRSIFINVYYLEGDECNIMPQEFYSALLKNLGNQVSHKEFNITIYKQMLSSTSCIIHSIIDYKNGLRQISNKSFVFDHVILSEQTRTRIITPKTVISKKRSSLQKPLILEALKCFIPEEFRNEKDQIFYYKNPI
jgi:hypothetical protein